MPQRRTYTPHVHKRTYCEVRLGQTHMHPIVIKGRHMTNVSAAKWAFSLDFHVLRTLTHLSDSSNTIYRQNKEKLS